MAAIFERSLQDESIREKYGEIFIYLCELSFFFKRVMKSCFGLRRDKSIADTSYFAYPESQIRQLIGEFFSLTRYLIEPYQEQLETYQIDLAQLILCLRDSYSEYSLRLTVTFHLMYHVCHIMFNVSESSNIGMGTWSCSEFERTHTRYKKKIENYLAKDTESLAYRKTIYQMTNAFNASIDNI